MNHSAPERPPLDMERLSPAERRVVHHALAGRSAREIAELLVLSEATVRSHLSRIYIKLDVSGQVELLSRAAVSARAGEASRPWPETVVPRSGHRPSGPLALLLVGLALLSVIPPVAVIVGPGLLAAGWLAGRRPATSAWRAARPWLLAVGAIITIWAAVVVILVVGLLGTGTGTTTSDSSLWGADGGAIRQPLSWPGSPPC